MLAVTHRGMRRNQRKRALPRQRFRIREIGQNLRRRRIAKLRLALAAQQIHPRPISAAGGEISVIGKGPFACAQTMPFHDVKRERAREPCLALRQRPIARLDRLQRPRQRLMGIGQRKRGRCNEHKPREHGGKETLDH